MQEPPTTTTIPVFLQQLSSRSGGFSAFLVCGLACASLTGTAHAQDSCPAPATGQPTFEFVETELDDDQDVVIESDSLDATLTGDWQLEGEVSIVQGQRRITTRDATYDPQRRRFRVSEGVEYADPNLRVRGAGAQGELGGGVRFDDAQFELPGRNARGGARTIQATAEGELRLDDVRYTTCPLGNDDWVLRASDIDIDQRGGLGSGRNVRLDFKGIPILYAPFISFPVGNERKSGFLYPNFGTSSSSGAQLSVPWYWNIAPNYDATFVPTWYSRRGAKLDTEFRWLEPFAQGQLDAEYLPDDRRFGDARSLVTFVNRSDFTERLRLDIDAANASDEQWFEDFGLGPEGTSISFLNRSANLLYLGREWFASLRAQNFQTIDETILGEDRPYTVLPQLAVSARLPDRPFGLTLGLDAELANFQRNDGITGLRLDVAPEVRMPLRSAGLYLEPAASWRYTGYRLDDTPLGQDDSPSRSAPIFSVDAGLTLERFGGSRGQRLHTLEPRVQYLYVPFRNQDDLPVFDTGLADLNLVQLFRTNRYVGADRLSDANQVSVGLTSRLIDAATGRQFIAATVGQAYYFRTPRVSLPGETLDDTEYSDIIAEVEMTAYRDWHLRMGVQWDPGETRSEKGEVRVRYQPKYDSVVNLGYRFRRDDLEQVEGSVAWPVHRNWSLYARMVYELDEEKTIDQLAGLEYRSCCWRLRAVTRRYVRNRAGDVDSSFMLQLELNGLSSVGVSADAFLERSIRGYSAQPAEMLDIP